MNDAQTALKVLLEKDGWEVFQAHFKGNTVIMQKEINNAIVYISIKEDGAVHFNRRPKCIINF